jgi:hypothetical protein
MRTVRLQGGLGNQLFCFAFAHSLSLAAKEPVALDLSSFQTDRYGRSFESEFAAHFPEFKLSNSCAWAMQFRRVAAKLVPGFGVIREPSAGAADINNLARRHGYFSGYWQNEAYLLDAPAFVAKVQNYLREKAPAAKRHELVVHVRSYEDEIVAERRTVPGRRYFAAAFDEIRRRHGTLPPVTLISDRPEVARRMLDGLGLNIEDDAGRDAHGDLRAMLLADNLILTNSSFSWWGGFCSDASTVVYPANDGFFHYPAPARRFTCL